MVWNTYSPDRFRKTFRVSRETFEYLLNRIRPSLERQSITEDAISPVCLYRLGRGDNYYTISELTGLGTSTVCEIMIEVSKYLKLLWNISGTMRFHHIFYRTLMN